jgi:hypothetical protein
MSDQQGTPYQQPTSAANDWAATLFVVNQILAGKATAGLVRVIACTNAGGIVPVGTVDVELLVNQVDGQGGSPTQHGPMYSLPYFRLQGGTFAAIIDPQPGDIGLAVFCMRDSTAAFAAKGPASPASADVMGFNSGMYFGGFLNATPTDYVAFVPGQGIKVVSPTAVTVQAPTVTVNASTKAQVTSPDIELTGNTTVTGTLTVTGAAALEGGLAVSGGSGTNTVAGTLSATVDVTANGKSLHNHVHGGVTTGSGSTAPPT